MGPREESSAGKKCSMNSELEKARGVNITQGTEEYLTPFKALGVYRIQSPSNDRERLDRQSQKENMSLTSILALIKG